MASRAGPDTLFGVLRSLRHQAGSGLARRTLPSQLPKRCHHILHHRPQQLCTASTLLAGAAVASRRAAHTIPRPTRPKPNIPTDNDPSSSSSAADAPTSESERPEIKNDAYYQLSFTCVPCGHRSHHNVSKQGYHTGSTLITCPGCRNRHVISDHLGIFGDRKITVEDLMREKGQLVKRGSLGEDGDVEFWPEEVSETPDDGGK